MKNNLSANSMNKPLDKPYDVINRIIALLEPYASEVSSPGPRGVISLRGENNEPIVILLLNGTIDSYRAVDNLLFVSAEAPIMLGLMSPDFRYDAYSFQLRKGSVAKTLLLKSAIELIEKNGLFRDLLLYLSYINHYLLHRSGLLINRSAYEIICELLRELDKISLEKKIKISVANYIQSRSNLSRSGIMRILSNMRRGGYILMENGKLMCILKSLPKNY